LSFAYGPEGDLYFASHSGVMKYDGIAGAFTSTLVPNGTGGLSLATDIAFGRDGNLYVNSFGNREILKFNGSTGLT
jgi:hypothetical protein